MILISVSCVSAIPPKPTEFYGTIRFFNTNVTIGRVVRAYDSSGALCGRFTVINPGVYGTLTCTGDDPDTPGDEGAVTGETIRFTVSNFNSTINGLYTWSSGTFRRVDMVVPEIVCGDDYCDLVETCASCPGDCGICPTIGDGGTSGGSSGATRAPPAGEGSGSTTPCRPLWICNEWGSCLPNNTQYRECYDSNECLNERDKPEEVRDCDYLAHCFDGIKNFDEIGVDCGGSCGPCPVPKPREQELETPSKRFPVVEYPGRICERVIDPLNPYLLMFLAIVLGSIFVRVVYAQNKIKKIKADKATADLEKAKLYLGVKRRMYLFIITLAVLTIFLLVYYYYFGICRDDNIKYLWLLFALLVISPVVIHRIMKFFEYTEEYKEEKYEKLLGQHYKNIMQLIDIENENLVEMEEGIAKNIHSLSEDAKFKQIMDQYPEIRRIYKSLLVLYDNYRQQKNPFSVERDLCISISDLETNKKFLAVLTKEPRLKAIFNALKVLYTHYEEKQHLYDELDEIEHPEKYEKKEKSNGGKGKEKGGDSEGKFLDELPEAKKGDLKKAPVKAPVAAQGAGVAANTVPNAVPTASPKPSS
ncbi:MAG: hypothetical protein ABIE94_01965 [archaeon]